LDKLFYYIDSFTEQPDLSFSSPECFTSDKSDRPKKTDELNPMRSSSSNSPSLSERMPSDNTVNTFPKDYLRFYFSLMDSEEWNPTDDSLPAFYSFFLHNYNNSSQNVTTDETPDYPLETLANRESLSEIKTIDSLNTEHNKVNNIRKNFF
jgi:hypothetical protein